MLSIGTASIFGADATVQTIKVEQTQQQIVFLKDKNLPYSFTIKNITDESLNPVNKELSGDYEFKGFGRIDSWNSFVLSVSMLSLIGIPPTLGFITKLFLFSSGIICFFIIP